MRKRKDKEKATPHNSCLAVVARRLRYKMLDNTQSMICTFCLAADAPHSLYWHVELRGIAKRKNKMEE